MWRKKVTYYLHSRKPEMKDVLRWAEFHEEPITQAAMVSGRFSNSLLRPRTEDPEDVAYRLWGFLNVSLMEDAWGVF